MLNLPKALRESLKAIFEIRPISVSHEQVSKDGTIKNAVRLADGLIVESVLIPTDRRITALYFLAGGLQHGVPLLRHGKA